MNAIRRALTAERKRLLKLSPVSIIQEQHASSSSRTRSPLRILKSSQTRVPEIRYQLVQPPAPPPSTTSSSSNDNVLKEPVTWPKPSEIPWQAKVVNSVNLIGRVKIPVQFEASSDGKYWAGTIISQDDGSESSSSLTSFWIPVIFEGDLAYIAMCHLKEKDYVHVAGHLSVDTPPFKLSEVQANVQVMVHSINFVQDIQSQKVSRPDELDSWPTKNSVHNAEETGRLHSGHKVDKPSIHTSWRDLLVNSKQWLDNRENKRNGLVKANYPDFKHKDTGVALWLDRAPAEILQGLGQLEFYVAPSKGEKGGGYFSKGEKGGGYFSKGEKGGAYFNKAEKGGGFFSKGEKGGGYFNKAEKGGGSLSKGEKDGDSWKHLVENPNKWWDNRLDKRNKKAPDFKNKDSGKGLWLGDAPAWALSSLPPQKS